MKKNLLLTGNPGIGKSTVIKKAVSGLKGREPRGFYTEEIREAGVRKGFNIITIDGKKGILAHCQMKSPYRVGKYGVSINDLERLAVPAIRPSGNPDSIIIIDEIGKMECYSKPFVEALYCALDSDNQVLGVIKKKGGALVKEIKLREDVELIEVTLENRDELPNQIVRIFELPSTG
jgi:nucleoside-triphosphatase